MMLQFILIPFVRGERMGNNEYIALRDLLSMVYRDPCGTSIPETLPNTFGSAAGETCNHEW
jgi:hypothetical protein